MGDARATAIFDADDSPLRQAILRGLGGIEMLEKKFKAVKGFLVGLAPVAGVIAGMAKISDVLDTGKELHDTKEATGLAVDEILKMREEFKLAGKDASDIAPAIQKMQKGLVNGGSAQAIAKLGLNLEDLKKKTPADQFHSIGKAIAGMADPAERSAAAMAIFGKTGASLLPVFANKNFGNMQLKKGDQLMAKDADLFADTKNKIQTLKPSFESFFVGMADKIIPVFRPLLDQLTKIDFATMGQAFAEPISTMIQLIGDGNFWTAAGQFLMLAGSELINVLWRGVQALGPLLSASLENDAMYFLKILEFCTKKDFWVGLGSALIALGSQFNALLLDGVAWVLEKLAEAPLIGGKGGKLAQAAASTREAAAGMRNQRDEYAGSATDKLKPYMEKAAQEYMSTVMKNISAGIDGYNGASNLIDTTKMSGDIAETMAKNKQRKEETSAKSFADAKPTEGTAVVDDYSKAPVVTALQRIGGAAGAGGGGIENLLRDSVSVGRQSLTALQGIHEALKPGRPSYAVLA